MKRLKNPNYTYFADVYPYALAKIDDIRLDKLLGRNPALLYRRMWLYMMNAIPKFTSPKGIKEILKYEKPIFSDFSQTGDGVNATFNTLNVDVDMAFISINGVVVNYYDSNDDKPDTSVYNPVLGTVTFDVAPELGADIDVDFYNDGYFIELKNDHPYIETIKSILGTCIELMWFTRIANNWLRIAPKLKDKNFSIDSSWNTEKADDARTKETKRTLNTEMRDFEAELAYQEIVPAQKQLLKSAGR